MRFVCCAKTSEIGLVKAAGYDLIEFSARLLSPISEAEAKEARRQLDDIGLACQNLNDYCGGTPAIVGPDYDGDAAVEYAKVVCERAAILGVQTIGIGAPMGRKLPAGYDPARADDQAHLRRRERLWHSGVVGIPQRPDL